MLFAHQAGGYIKERLLLIRSFVTSSSQKVVFGITAIARESMPGSSQGKIEKKDPANGDEKAELPLGW
jgi:hypothetical protein